MCGQVSLARFTTCMHPSNVERRWSRPLCRWDVEAIVEICGGYEESAYGTGCEGRTRALTARMGGHPIGESSGEERFKIINRGGCRSVHPPTDHPNASATPAPTSPRQSDDTLSLWTTVLVLPNCRKIAQLRPSTLPESVARV